MLSGRGAERRVHQSVDPDSGGPAELVRLQLGGQEFATKHLSKVFLRRFRVDKVIFDYGTLALAKQFLSCRISMATKYF